MSYLGPDPNPFNLSDDAFVGDGSAVTFNLTRNPGSKNAILVFIEGIFQNNNTYDVEGKILTLCAAPPSNANISVRYLGSQGIIGVPGDGAVGQSQLNDNYKYGWVFIEKVTASAVANTALNLPSEFLKHRVDIAAMSTDTDSSNLAMRLRTTGGSVQTTGYQQIGTAAYDSAAIYTEDRYSGSDTVFQVQASSMWGNAAGEDLSMSVHIDDAANGSVNTKVNVSFPLARADTNPGQTIYTGYLAAEANDQLTIFENTNALLTFTAYVFGLRLP